MWIKYMWHGDIWKAIANPCAKLKLHFAICQGNYVIYTLYLWLHPNYLHDIETIKILENIVFFYVTNDNDLINVLY